MNNDLLTQSITKALAYAENGGKPDLANLQKGKTGEMKSIFQFTPDTWKKDSQEVFGKPAELNPDNETYVVTQKVSNWIKKGYNARQIASMWNAGEGEPDSYTGKFSTGKESKGVNQQYNIPYDVPSYANKVLKYSKQFYNEKQNKQMNDSEKQANTHLDSVVSMMKQTSRDGKPKASNQSGLLSKVMSSIKKTTA